MLCRTPLKTHVWCPEKALQGQLRWLTHQSLLSRSRNSLRYAMTDDMAHDTCPFRSLLFNLLWWLGTKSKISHLCVCVCVRMDFMKLMHAQMFIRQNLSTEIDPSVRRWRLAGAQSECELCVEKVKGWGVNPVGLCSICTAVSGVGKEWALDCGAEGEGKYVSHNHVKSLWHSLLGDKRFDQVIVAEKS